MRIISLVPSQTELLHYLGLEDEVVGITKFCIHPEHWYRNKVRVGGTKQYHFDRIEALNPTLILTNKEENDKEQVEALAQKYPVWTSEVKTIQDAYGMIKKVGELVSRTKQAKQLIEDLQAAFSKLKKMSPKKVAYLIWQKPFMTIGGDTFINAMLEQAGWINVFVEKTRYPEITLEQIQTKQTDLILLASEPFPFKQKHQIEIKKQLASNSQTKVLLVDGEMFSWYGSRLLKTPAYLGKLKTKHSPTL